MEKVIHLRGRVKVPTGGIVRDPHIAAEPVTSCHLGGVSDVNISVQSDERDQRKNSGTDSTVWMREEIHTRCSS